MSGLQRDFDIVSRGIAGQQQVFAGSQQPPLLQIKQAKVVVQLPVIGQQLQGACESLLRGTVIACLASHHTQIVPVVGTPGPAQGQLAEAGDGLAQPALTLLGHGQQPFRALAGQTLLSCMATQFDRS